MSNARERLEEYGVPAEAVSDLLREELAPLFGGLGAIQELRQDPYFRQHEHEIARYMQRPDVAEHVARIGQNDPGAALEYATARFRVEGSSPGRPLRPRPSDLPERSMPAGADYGELPDVATARQEYLADPTRRNVERYAKARLRTVIPDEFLNQ